MSKKRIFAPILMTALTALLFCSCIYFIGNAEKQFPSVTQMNYNFADGAAPLKISDMESLAERISMKKISFCSELEAVKANDEIITPVLTNDKYFEIYAPKLNGEGITEETVTDKERVAVIGSTLALKLFFNTDAVGKTITINDEEYTVSGVIEENDALINQISGDGKQRVYISYTCYADYKDCIMNIIAYDNSAPSAALFEQMGLTQYHSTNLSEKSKVIQDYEHILFLILFIALCIIALRIWYLLCKKFLSQISENLKENYFWKSVKAIPIKYILFIITAVGIPAVLFFLLFFSDFSIYIVSKYIPYDNIFEIPHYVNTFTENANSLNSLALSGNTYLLQLYTGSCGTIMFLLILFCIALLISLLLWRNFVKAVLKKRT